MAKSQMQKLKLVYLMNYLLDETDEEHPVTMADILNFLSAQGISAERKSVYDDLEMLETFGLDVIKTKGKNFGYYIGSRDFELPELKLLVDAVQSSKFFTESKSKALIKKIERLASVHQAKQLERQVVVANRTKTLNEKIYLTVDKIHFAISENKKISFKYFEWTSNKEKVYKHDGKNYILSPWALTWDDENYYLVAYDGFEEKIKHFRVDKMDYVRPVDEEREGQDQFDKFDMASYSKSVFGMFGGKAESVTLRCDNSLAGVIIDRFGQEAVFRKVDEDHFDFTASAVLSPQFYSWVFGFGGRMKIIESEKAKKEFLEQLNCVKELYK